MVKNTQKSDLLWYEIFSVIVYLSFHPPAIHFFNNGGVHSICSKACFDKRFGTQLNTAELRGFHKTLRGSLTRIELSAQTVCHLSLEMVVSENIWKWVFVSNIFS